MPAYEVMYDCATGETGQLVKGQVVTLDEDVAAWLNGLLEDGHALEALDGPKAKPTKAKPEPADAA